jgi:hypothetical protein
LFHGYWFYDTLLLFTQQVNNSERLKGLETLDNLVVPVAGSELIELLCDCAYVSGYALPCPISFPTRDDAP